MAPPKLTEATIRAGATEASFQRGLELYRSGAIGRTTIQGSILSGECEGRYAPYYRLRAEIDAGGIQSATCTCPYDSRGYCKHVIALLLAYIHEPQRFQVRKAPAELLADLDREQLLALVTSLLEQQPDLYELVEERIALSAAPGNDKKKRTGRKRADAETYRRRVRGIMHSLDHMRPSQAYWHVGDLVGQLEEVEKTALDFLHAGDAETALEILMAIAEEAHTGFDYIDDSNGELGDFLSGLGEPFAEVILSADLDRRRRRELAGELERIHESLSDYGVEGLFAAVMSAKYGWEELPRELATGPLEAGDEESDFGSGPPEYPDTYGTLVEAKLNVLERQGHTDEYLALCLETGAHLRYVVKLCDLGRVAEGVSHGLRHLAAAPEALLFAKHLRQSGHLDDAVRVAERGLKLDGYKAALGTWLGPVEEAQGRTPQALEAWLAAFRESPSLQLYRTLQRLAGAKWNRLKKETMSILEKRWDKRPLAEVLLFEKMWDAAIKVADEKGADYQVVAMVADAVISHQPEWVARVSTRQAEDLIERTQSKYYVIAAEWLRRAKAAYSRMGRADEWKEYVQQLKEKYKRRYALQAQLASL